MPIAVAAPWHTQSFDRFTGDRLPNLLAERMPLAGYQVESTGPTTCCVRVTVAGAAGDVEVAYADLPRPDDDGVFHVADQRRVVVPVASSEHLDRADIRCVGEQLHAWVDQRLGEAPADLQWDENLVRTWLPLDRWVGEFLRTSDTAQPIDQRNWLSEQCHLRRLLVPDRQQLITQGQFGRTCPFETPEGPNIGRVLSVALGAEIRDGRLVILDERPEAALGLTAAMIPFIEHDDPNRTLMGVNMMRQWLVPSEPEPALVQTGHEPDAARFWCGHNLLTAFVSWGGDTFEDGIVLSRSAADRMACPQPIQVGDKLSNRHGTKGTVGRILPDEDMPHLPDGTPLEIVFNFIGCHTRLNFGQVREAVMGRIARAEGRPALVPPFHAPKPDALRGRLRNAEIDESGMDTLRVGHDGPELDGPSTVGWVYWGCTCHLARDKARAWVSSDGGQMQVELDYVCLRDVGALETIREMFHTRDAERPDADTLAQRVAAGPVEQADPPSMLFAQLARRLAAAGIRMAFDGRRVSFTLSPPEGDVLSLARPVPHPWLKGHELAAIGTVDELDAYGAVCEANARLQRMLDSGAPHTLVDQAFAPLGTRVQSLFEVLVQSDADRPHEEARSAAMRFQHSILASYTRARFTGVRFQRNVLFSARAVISPGTGLRPDQLGLADEIAWTLFGPLVARELGSADPVPQRTDQAAEVLDRVMASSWVIVNRAPTIMSTATLAFHPVRIPEQVLRLHPLACRLMNADHDGDQAAVFLPITEAGQREAAERLSIAGHLQRDPSLVKWLVPWQDILLGLAILARQEAGRRELADLLGSDVTAAEGFLTQASVADALGAILARDGADATLALLQQLVERGLAVVQQSGASIAPFIEEALDRPPAPCADDTDTWNAHAHELAERIARWTDLDHTELGPQVLAVKTGARGNVRQLQWLLGTRGTVVDVDDRPVTVVRHGLAQGLTPQELYACVIGARKGLGRTVEQMMRIAYGVGEPVPPKGWHVLARAMRAPCPGIVFASAAATGEVDPLTDVDSRLFVGLPAG